MSSVYIFSKLSPLAKLLVEKFYSLGLVAQVVDEHVDTSTLTNSDYAVFVLDQLDSINLEKSEELLKTYLKISEKTYKSVFIFPLTEKPDMVTKINFWAKTVLEVKKDLSGVVLLGDPVLQFEPLIFAQLSNIYHKKAKLSGHFYPIDVFWSVTKIVEIVLSMKAFGRITALLGSRHIVGTGTQDVQNCLYEDVETCPSRVVLNEPKNVILSNNKLFSQTKKEVPTGKQKVLTRPKLGLPKFKAAKFGVAFGVVLLVVAFYIFTPFFVSTLALGLLKLSSFGHFDSPTNKFKITDSADFLAKSSFNISEKRLHKKLLPNYYKNEAAKAQKIGVVASLVSVASTTSDSGLNLLQSVAEGDIDWRETSNFLGNLKLIETGFGFLQADKENLEFARKHGINIPTDLDGYRQELRSYISILRNSDSLLGKGQTKNYLIAISDSATPGASTGEIRAIASLSLRDGRLLKKEIYTANYLNNNFNGEVGEPNGFLASNPSKVWNISSVNWLSDFTETAEALGWFVEKSLDKDPDGVILVSSLVAEEVLALQKNIDTSGWKIVGDEDVFAEKLRNVVAVLWNNDSYKDTRLIRKIGEALESKEILFYFNNTDVQEQILQLGWGGSVVPQNASSNAFLDFISEIELPDTPGFTNVQKETDINISIEEGVVKKRITVYLKNLNSKVYRTTVRLVGRLDSSFSPVILIAGNTKKELEGLVDASKNHKVNEVDISIDPLETIGLSFYSEVLMPGELDNYVINILKQPGFPSSELSVKVVYPGKVLSTTSLGGSLTEDGSVVYNTKLSTDNLLKVGW